MSNHKKDGVFVTAVILGAIILFTLINIAPTFTGYTIFPYSSKPSETSRIEAVSKDYPESSSIDEEENKYPTVPYIIGIIFLITSLYISTKIERLKYHGNKKLINYIQNNYDTVFHGGISSFQLKKELKNNGFSNRLFKDAFKSIYKNFFKDYLLLERYIENKLLMNVPKKKIKEELLKKGWRKEIINNVFNKDITNLRFKKR